jgi:radical SAM protein with 4Fe4S-binding SPASM domain
MLAALETAGSGMSRGGSIDVRIKHWDVLQAWSVHREEVQTLCDYLSHARHGGGSLLLFSELGEIDPGLWHFVYHHSRVRIAWVARELEECADESGLHSYLQESAAIRNLQEISGAGFWPHVVLPASGANVKALPWLVVRLLEATRGGSIEILPTNYLSHAPHKAAPPPVGDYVEALLQVYRNPRVPCHLVSPICWVAARINSELPLLSSPTSAGMELAALPSGDLFASEAAVGIDRWHLGNVLDDPKNIRWERLDVIPELLSPSSMPAQCKQCDWRYRCGGVDASVYLLEDQQGSPCMTSGTFLAQRHMHAQPVKPVSLTELYCAPRKALFEELVWGQVEACVNGQSNRPRERLELSEDGVHYVPIQQDT